jgi:pyrimidine operon attenuation protein/uracil phosphoribosyltransferase
MPESRVLILNHVQIERKIVRIAHEIFERNYDAHEVIIVGIHERGAEIARMIYDRLKAISPLELKLHTLVINKDKPLSEKVQFDGETGSLKNKNVILVDDVLNSGRTLIYAAQFILNEGPKALSTATLVDRVHRKFPIRADYVGMTLSTNLKEHVAVIKEKGKYCAYLE